MDPLYVALLRGVNVGGVKVLMQPLIALCEGFGWTDVRTYIASGNVMFRAEGEPRALAEQLKSGLNAAIGVSPDVLVIRAARFLEIACAHPFSPERGNQSHIYFCWDTPALNTEHIDAFRSEGESLMIIDGHVHFEALNGLGRSKLAEKFDKVIIGSQWTGRNMNTVRKLCQWAEDDRASGVKRG